MNHSMLESDSCPLLPFLTSQPSTPEHCPLTNSEIPQTKSPCACCKPSSPNIRLVSWNKIALGISAHRLDRTSPNMYEFMMGLHWWLRQIDIHFGYYHHWRTVMLPEKKGTAPDLQSTQAPLPSSGVTTPKDLLKVELLTSPHFQKDFTRKDVRMKIRNKEAFAEVKEADKIQEVAEELVTSSLLFEVVEQQERKQKGRKIKKWHRCALETVQGSEAATRERKRLKISLDSFEVSRHFFFFSSFLGLHSHLVDLI